MIDMPQTPPSAYEQVLVQKLVRCGLRPDGFTVRYEAELQSVEVVIGEGSGATKEHVECIRQAAGSEIVTIRDPAVQRAYEDRIGEVMRPVMLASAKTELERRGVLNDFPRRSAYPTDKAFAEALERQCGLVPGAMFVESAGGLILRPDAMGGESFDKLTCVLAAARYAQAQGDRFTFGIIGNEQFAPDPEKAVPTRPTR
ncbi:hypothetical protein ASE90_18315 [Sphingomonas sp. Leaf67]|uniref:hypothetical protein n=1 Tax=Sphingomonas sp. Leaf67 TaxID=1736230 RepID=UPI0006FD6378|nr:hypothetical protein [Sphingomonas sp. Leaf67]KQN88878.1 hypothetical protein ASE90_18315 [Sphingomonas sp. Leaf67]